MNRDYASGQSNKVVFFRGVEVEHTPAYGMETLFVTGVQDATEIEKHLEACKHVFFGANHSFNPTEPAHYEPWETMIEHFLRKDILCTLDIPLSIAEEFLEGPLVEYDNFIPQIRVAIPYIKQYNYNTMIKIDDKDFQATNPGVWCHRLHDLMNSDVFTPWHEYKNDEVIK